MALYMHQKHYQLLCGLLRHCKSLNPEAPNFLDRNDHRFRELHNVCDSYFRRLHSEGVGSEVKETPTISKEEENELWRIGYWVYIVQSPSCVLCSFVSVRHSALGAVKNTGH